MEISIGLPFGLGFSSIFISHSSQMTSVCTNAFKLFLMILWYKTRLLIGLQKNSLKVCFQLRKKNETNVSDRCHSSFSDKEKEALICILSFP